MIITWLSFALRSIGFLILAASLADSVTAADLPDASKVKTVKLLEVPNYCEGVVFDHDGNGYISWKDTITQFTLEGKQKVWAVTGAPNGHKILADGTHLVCDASHHAVLHLDASGRTLEPASKECEGKSLRGPNDLTLDADNGGFYFTDPGDSGLDNLIGTVHYVDKQGKTHLVAGGLAYSNGIVVALDGKRLLVAESQKNRVLEYPLLSPGKVGPMKVFADLPKHESGRWQDDQPDGMCLDAAGNLYVAHYGMKQVQVLSPEGRLLARYDGGNRTTSNVAFGGPNMDQLFITGGLDAEGGPGGLFRIDLKVKGLVILPPRGK
jgi:gluconolactonase